ncbi:MAG: Mut7-C RNAse domain-containing protein [Candidatus Sumerlaeia bacterium]|nr:Mut7-C RNAse domain-containing protein [Candidatus Sumerlaeia bacterium]
MSDAQSAQYKFIADTMLGRLARWLSLLGYDIVYSGVIDDEELVRQARANQRIILTRDTRLKNTHPDVSVLVLKTTDRWEQLREVIMKFPLNFSETAFTRCQQCNVEIIVVDKKEVLERLPPFVRQTQETIYQCPQCQKLYWEASHIDHIKSLLKQHLNIDL